MGLFGGFKAQFTKNSVAKAEKKSNKRSEVVCVAYRVYSEFLDPPQYFPPTEEPPTRKRLSGIRTVLPKLELKSKEEIVTNGTVPSTSVLHTPASIETKIITNPITKKSTNKKRPPEPSELPKSPPSEFPTSLPPELPRSSPPDLPKSMPPEFPGSSPPDIPKSLPPELPKRSGSPASSEILHESRAFIELRRHTKSPKSAPSSVYVTGKTSSFNPAVSGTNAAPKSILKAKSYNDISTVDIGKVTLPTAKSLTQIEPSHDENEEVTTTIRSQEGFRAVETNSNYQSQSTVRTFGSTSNFAASIFFGRDEETTVQRPRKANWDDIEEDC